MRCVFPSCKVSDTSSPEISLYSFPEKATLRKAWLKALRLIESELVADSAVCSHHFLPEKFILSRGCWKLLADAVPIDHVQVCRICFAEYGELYLMKDNIQPDLMRPSYGLAYETLTGLSVKHDHRLPPYLCVQCANQLLMCVRFMAKTTRSHTILSEIVNDNAYITLDSIRALNKNQNIETEPSQVDEQGLNMKDDHVAAHDMPSSNLCEDVDYGTLGDNNDIEPQNEQSNSDVVNDSDIRHQSSAIARETMSVRNNYIETKQNDSVKPKDDVGLVLTYRYWSCSICSYQTIHKTLFNQHLKVHDAAKLYTCDKCDFVTKSMEALQFHIKSHPDMKLTCGICSKKFRSNANLKTHLQIHMEEKPHSFNIRKKSRLYNRI